MKKISCAVPADGSECLVMFSNHDIAYRLIYHVVTENLALWYAYNGQPLIVKPDDKWQYVI